MVRIVLMVIMVVRTERDGTSKRHGTDRIDKSERTDQIYKSASSLDFPGYL